MFGIGNGERRSHCHILHHEDTGMMMQTSITEDGSADCSVVPKSVDAAAAANTTATLIVASTASQGIAAAAATQCTHWASMACFSAVCLAAVTCTFF